MPRRTHSESTRPVFDSSATFDSLHEELQRTWRTWQQAAAGRAQAKRIEQFRRTYDDR